MAKIKYYYDTETCKYERIKVSRGEVLLNSVGFLSIALIMAVGLVFIFNYFFESPKETRLKNEVKELQYYYNTIQKEVSKMSLVLKEMEYRDDNVYRAVLGAEPIEKSIREAGVGGTERYADLKKSALKESEMILKLSTHIDKLKRKLYIESRSQEDILEMAHSKEKQLAAIPASCPISNRNLLSIASGFGMRTHPILKIRKMHPGMDFAAKTGTPIYSTADGVVDVTNRSFTGYGNMIEVDHGFSYRTRYAHMQGFVVRKGQKVKRGDLLGYVGSTGLSTAPHCHYEVFVNGKQVNPVYYILGNVSVSDYEKIVEMASIENQSLGM